MYKKRLLKSEIKRVDCLDLTPLTSPHSEVLTNIFVHTRVLSHSSTCTLGHCHVTYSYTRWFTPSLNRSHLAPAFALLGCNFKSVWPVLLHLYGQLSLLAVSWWLTLTCHHLEVDKLGKRKMRQGRSVKPLSFTL